MNLIFLGWHVPSAYDFALEHERWHDFEHICFLGSSIAFLVADYSPMANQRALSRLGDAAVPGGRGHREHGAISLPRLLQPARLQLLSDAAKHLRRISHGGSGHRRSDHVGCRVTGFPYPGGIHHRQASAAGLKTAGVIGRIDETA